MGCPWYQEGINPGRTDALPGAPGTQGQVLRPRIETSPVIGVSIIRVLVTWMKAGALGGRLKSSKHLKPKCLECKREPQASSYFCNSDRIKGGALASEICVVTRTR